MKEIVQQIHKNRLFASYELKDFVNRIITDKFRVEHNMNQYRYKTLDKYENENFKNIHNAEFRGEWNFFIYKLKKKIKKLKIKFLKKLPLLKTCFYLIEVTIGTVINKFKFFFRTLN